VSDDGGADPRRFAGATVPETEFAGDDGSADPRVIDALSAYAGSRNGLGAVVAALLGVRLMTPLVAVLDEAEDPGSGAGHGLRQEKSSHLASVSLVAPDGRRALLAFTSVAAMAAWDPAARGIPAPATRVAAAALDEGADAVLLDLGSDLRCVVDGTALASLAQGVTPPPAYADPLVLAAVDAALAVVDGLRSARVAPPSDPHDADAPDLLVLVEPWDGVDPGPLAREVAERLLEDPAVSRACRRGVAVGLAGVTGA
jgi:hypothetical protein